MTAKATSGKCIEDGGPFRALRYELDLTQEEMAEWLKVSQSQVSKFEKGLVLNIGCQVLVRLCFNVDLNIFMPRYQKFVRDRVFPQGD